MEDTDTETKITIARIMATSIRIEIGNMNVIGTEIEIVTVIANEIVIERKTEIDDTVKRKRAVEGMNPCLEKN